MSAPTSTLEAPAPELIARHRIGVAQSMKELLGRRQLVRTLVERELRVRYKQTFLGAAWAIIIPVVLMLIFTFLFRRVVQIDTGGAPPALFFYLGTLPWAFFSSSLSQGGTSLI
jgi:ABC-type polysaccharide/polyol phosphate export permease